MGSREKSLEQVRSCNPQTCPLFKRKTGDLTIEKPQRFLTECVLKHSSLLVKQTAIVGAVGVVALPGCCDSLLIEIRVSGSL